MVRGAKGSQSLVLTFVKALQAPLGTARAGAECSRDRCGVCVSDRGHRRPTGRPKEGMCEECTCTQYCIPTRALHHKFCSSSRPDNHLCSSSSHDDDHDECVCDAKPLLTGGYSAPPIPASSPVESAVTLKRAVDGANFRRRRPTPTAKPTRGKTDALASHTLN